MREGCFVWMSQLFCFRERRRKKRYIFLKNDIGSYTIHQKSFFTLNKKKDHT